MPKPLETEIAIMGGGLAGLTLAIHLRQRNPGLSIHVIERHRHPVREAAFKVGESTVEIGAHYLAKVLGLQEHLDSCHLRKFGFRFFFSDGREDIDRCTEIGVSRVLPTPSWQIDRGRFENFLGEHARSIGVRFDSGATVRKIELSANSATTPHCVEFEPGKEEELQKLYARWLIDASGRAGLLKRKLKLARANQHDANAVWWRVEGHIDPHDWSENREWLGRCDPPDRWRSTNHLCGPGYWVWLIPLASGSHSIGIVCDAKTYPIEQMNSHEKAMHWLGARQPRVARALTEKPHAVQDFGYFRNYSYDCAELLSDQRWAITGEAGLFLDPFYSPGTDFIALANTYICDLVERDLQGEPIATRSKIYQQIFRSFYDNTLTLYKNQYALFGDDQVMPVKVIWDYVYYWALLAPLFCADRLTDLSILSSLREQLAIGRELNRQLQELFREWGEKNRKSTKGNAQGRLLDQYQINWFCKMNEALSEHHDDVSFKNAISKNIDRMQKLAQEISDHARGELRPRIKAKSTIIPVEIQTRLSELLQPEWYGIIS